jgi:predicted lipoprotein
MTVGEKLATKFEEANDKVIATVEGASNEQWKLKAAEGWPSGVTLHHIAESYAGLTQMVKAVAEGTELPHLTKEMLDQGNAEHATRAADATQAETAQILRESGKEASAMLRSLSDAEFSRRAAMPLGGAEMSAQEIAEAVLLGHGLGHLKGVQEAFATA